MKQAYVDANYRFIAAYQEVNTRIAQRQQALVLYVTLVVSLLASLVALKSANVSEHAPIEWLLLGFPVASIALALLNYKAERSITNLRRFLSALEQLNGAHDMLPSYNTDPQWSQGANKARRFHDFAAAALVIGSNGLGFVAFFEIYPERIHGNILVIGIAALVTVLSIIAILVNPRWSYRPS